MSTTEVVVILVAAVGASIVKAMLGSGYPLILIPAIALFLTVEDAVVIVAPANLALNVLLAVQLRHFHPESPDLGRFVGASVIGAVIGAVLLPVLPDRVLRMLLIVVIVLFLASRFRQVQPTMPGATIRRVTPLVGGVAGLFQGATGVSGPIVAPWYLTLGLDRDTFVYSVTVVYGSATLAQLVLLVAQGLFTVERTVVGLVLIPIALLAAPIGNRLRGRLGLAVFENLVLAVLVASAVSLAVRSF